MTNQPDAPDLAQQTPPPTPVLAAAPNRTRLIQLVGAFLAGVATCGLTVAIFNMATSGTDGQFASAVESCDDPAGVSVADEGATLIFNSKGDEDFDGASVVDLICILDALEAPSAVLTSISQTTALDGRQTSSWGDIDFAYSYHPDRGVDGVFTKSSR